MFQSNDIGARLALLSTQFNLIPFLLHASSCVYARVLYLGTNTNAIAFHSSFVPFLNTHSRTIAHWSPHWITFGTGCCSFSSTGLPTNPMVVIICPLPLLEQDLSLSGCGAGPLSRSTTFDILFVHLAILNSPPDRQHGGSSEEGGSRRHLRITSTTTTFAFIIIIIIIMRRPLSTICRWADRWNSITFNQNWRWN